MCLPGQTPCLKASPFLLKADATPCSRSETQHDVPSWKRFTTEFYALFEAAKSSRPQPQTSQLYTNNCWKQRHRFLHHQGTTGITWSLNGNRTPWLSHQWRRGWTNQGWWRRPPALAIAKRDKCYQLCVLITCILVVVFFRKSTPNPVQNMTWIHSCLHFRSYKWWAKVG